MQPNFTRKFLRTFCFKIIATSLIFFSFINESNSQILINEGFDVASPLPAGWAAENLSAPVGTTGWFQGNPTVFPSQSGASDSYIGANYNNTGGNGTISNWLFSPNITIQDGDVFSFYTTAAAGGGAFPDRLQVRLSTNGASVNTGATATSVGDFTNLLLDINPTYSGSAYPESWTKYTITISGVPTPTSGRFAFRYFVEDAGLNGTNSNYIGIDEVQYAVPCSGTPAPGVTESSANPVCTGINFTLSLENATGANATYQWQSSPDNTTWTDIGGATSASLVRNQAVATWYRCNVTCSGNTGTSTELEVTMNGPLACYCIPIYTNGCSFGDYIANVTLGTLNNSSACSDPSYTYYSNVAAPSLIQGATYPVSVTVGPDFFGQYVGLWADFNQDGDFADAGEFLGVSGDAGANGTVIINITVPSTANLGTTRFRVRGGDDAPPSGTQACGASNASYGEAEDYNLEIVPCTQGLFTAQPANKSISCSGSTIFNVTATGSALSYAWQYRVNAGAPWQTVSDGGIYSGSATDTLVLTNVSQSYNNYQYRALISGPCTAIDFSNAATLTVNPLVATVAKTPTGNICLGSTQQLNITNTTPVSNVLVSSNPNLGITIPDDGSTTGVNNTLTLTGIPSGVLITSIKVKTNLTHSWAGDMIVVVKAPNGNVINLAYALNASAGTGPTTGFQPTFSSTLSPPKYLDAGTDPFNSTFSADGYDPATGDPTVPTGPDGYLPTSTSTFRNTFADLYTSAANASTLNGTWTLAMYDYYPDFTTSNTFNNWSVEIEYSGGLANGVWTSPSSTDSLFTDAAATAQYDGVTPINTVYAKPATGGTKNYSVVVTSGACTSPALTVPITVIGPVTDVIDPTDKSVCIGGSTSFTSSASGGPFSSQWQVSTDAGATWSDINGATSATLSVAGATLTMNNNRYRCNYTNDPCTDTVSSAAAILTVNSLPAATISASVVTLSPSQSSTITANSTPAAGAGGWAWTLNGSALSGNSNTQTVTIDGLGTYQATVTDIHGCQSTSNELVIGAGASDKLWIYPNPSSGSFQVRLYHSSDASEKRKVSIYNLAGKVVEVREFTLVNTTPPYLKMDFDLSHLGHGTYVVKVAQLYSGKVVSGLVVVE